jgi:hypothetical protein
MFFVWRIHGKKFPKYTASLILSREEGSSRSRYGNHARAFDRGIPEQERLEREGMTDQEAVHFGGVTSGQLEGPVDVLSG